MVFWLTVKIGDHFYKAVLDTGAALLIMARRLLKQAKIRKGLGIVEPSIPWGGVDVTVCLGDEAVTQHCKVLDTDAFDIVTGISCAATPM